MTDDFPELAWMVYDRHDWCILLAEIGGYTIGTIHPREHGYAYTLLATTLNGITVPHKEGRTMKIADAKKEIEEHITAHVAAVEFIEAVLKE